MHLDQKYISYQQSAISYRISGSGPQTVICLHGFNESAEAFAVLQDPANRYTFLAIDAPFHGNTLWKEGLRFTPAMLHEVIQNILAAESRSTAQPLTLLGFSLGGRMCLSYYQQYPQQVNRLLLLAPDGLKMSFWYWFSAHTIVGNRLFAVTMKHPGWLIKFAGILHKTGVVNAGIKKFTVRYLHHPPVRNLLYTVWTAFRFFRPDIAQIKKSIARNQTPVHLYFGKYDKVIPASRGADFTAGIEEQVQTVILEAGHRLLQNKEVQEILDPGHFE
ncbi:alpha/beta hydrolase [Niabella drilacis]|uniref:Pimeloyl-ACP methyl ester carboxylesterase n=1 Tax=Niabella drilacis (strain DSM 25811 / CCM 8410 / CCUG 62505 / LMG 26954 / E90) TaxID=1285928 RepID=A0A1G6YW16_NIADE|nr:alpha/beta hydrolase [Niabella drilacis]SDD93817.1 Pimeloyl-ACP methyl ester carboxylesterase [Niabella drilacis]